MIIIEKSNFKLLKGVEIEFLYDMPGYPTMPVTAVITSNYHFKINEKKYVRGGVKIS